MFEGKHIHFSPLDNKPLCSYSSKLCRQRRLNGYAFCIRHILEDKSAPFKQCGFVTRNNYQKCLNAIPSNQERGYCHSHMQVAGIIPKTERKPKVTNNSVGSSTGQNSSNNNNNNHSNGSGAAATSSSSSQSQKNKNSDAKTASKGDEARVTKEVAVKANQNRSSNPASNSTSIINSSNNHSSSASSKITPTHKGKSYLAASNISSTNTGLKISVSSDAPIATSPICGKNTNNKNNGSLSNNLNEPSKKIINSTTKANQKISNESQSTGTSVKKELPRKLGHSNSKLTSGESIVAIHHLNPPSNGNGNPKKKTQPQSYGKSGSGKASVVDKSTLSSSNKNNVANSNSNGSNSVSARVTTVPTTSSSTPTVPTSVSSGTGNPVSTLCVRDRWKSFKFLSQDSLDSDIKPARQLEQMKTIKILEKLPLFAEVSSNPNVNNNTPKSEIKTTICSRGENGLRSNNTSSIAGLNSNSCANTIPISSGIEILLGPPFLSKTKLFSINKSKGSLLSKGERDISAGNENLWKGTGSTLEKGKNPVAGEVPSNTNNNNRLLKLQLQQGQDVENKKVDSEVEVKDEDLLNPWEWENRKQFLKRVRTAFKRQYKTIRQACKLSEKQDKNEKGFRDALLTCAMSDSSLCAQILSTSDSKLDEICTVLLTSKSKAISENQNTHHNVVISDREQNPPRLSSVSRTNAKIQNKAGSGSTSSVNVNGMHSLNNSSNNNNGKIGSTKNSGGGGASMDMKSTTLSMNGDLLLCRNDKSCIALSLNDNDNKDSFHSEMGISSASAKGGNHNSSFKLNSGANCMWNNMDAEPKKLKPRKKLNSNLKSSGLSNGTGTNTKSMGTVNVNLNGSKKTSGGNEINETVALKKKAKKTKASSLPSSSELSSSSASALKRAGNKKRKVESVDKEDSSAVSDMDYEREPKSNSARQLNVRSKNTIVLHSDDSHSHSGHNHSHLLHDTLNSHEQLLGVSSSVDLQAVANLETVLHSVSSSSDAATTPEGVITDASFDSPFDHSTSSHPDCEFSDDDLEKSFELQIDPEIAHQASRLLEDNGLTEDDFNELFPETRMGDHKLIGRADLTDLGIDFTSNFDANDIDYSLFANIFPNFRSNQPESISVNHQF